MKTVQRTVVRVLLPNQSQLPVYEYTLDREPELRLNCLDPVPISDDIRYCTLSFTDNMTDTSIATTDDAERAQMSLSNLPKSGIAYMSTIVLQYIIYTTLH